MRRALLGFVPWALVLALHKTPWGGGTQDHRYLIPLLPFAAIGLALAWAHAGVLVRGLLGVLAVTSAVLVWRHFLAWHEAVPFDRMWLGFGAAGVLAVAAAVAVLVRRKLGSTAHPC